MGPKMIDDIRRLNGFCLLLLALVGMATSVFGAGEGTTAASFLQIGTSARGEAMGGAFTAVVNDVDATSWNPAGLSQLQRSTVGFTHLEWFQGIRYEYLSYADKLDYIGAIGATVGYLNFGDIPTALETPYGDYDSLNSSGTFRASDLVLGVAWAGSFLAHENKVGVGAKLFQEMLADNQSFGVALDIGDQWLLSRSEWYRKACEENWVTNLIPGTLALALKNVGTPMKYSLQSDPLPTTAQFGVAYKTLSDSLTLALDWEYRMSEGASNIHAGVEYWLHTGWGDADDPLDLAVRAGYRTGYAATSASGLSYGAGLVFSSLGLDYVFMPFGELGTTHRIELKFSWGPLLKDKILVKHKRLVKRTLSPSEMAMQQTASDMMKSRQSMEENVTVNKLGDPKRPVNKLGALRPGETPPSLESQQPGGEGTSKTAQSGGLPKQSDAGAKGRVKTRELPGALVTESSRTDNNALIAEITRNASTQAALRTRTQYTRRTTEDAVRAAKQEAEHRGQAFNDIESAAQKDAKQTTMDNMVTKTTVYFAKDSDSLKDKYLYALDQISLSFDQIPLRTILVHGYTSSDEKDANALSLRRAKAVKDYLVQIKSVPNGKVALKGFGDKDPAADNASDKGRAQNRRVRVQIIQAGN